MKKILMIFAFLAFFATAAWAAVDINTADQEALQSVSGIGPAKAAAIIRHRESHGAFARVEDLLQVKGIGGALLEKIRDQVEVSHSR